LGNNWVVWSKRVVKRVRSWDSSLSRGLFATSPPDPSPDPGEGGNCFEASAVREGDQLKIVGEYTDLKKAVSHWEKGRPLMGTKAIRRPISPDKPARGSLIIPGRGER
jgi:hypothetical protein